MISNFVLVVLLSVHLAIAVCYFLFRKKVAGSNSQAVSETFFVLLIPVFGLLFLVIVNTTRYFRKKGEETADIYHQFKNEFLILGEQAQYESDILPLNDVLSMDNAQQKRMLLTDAIKQNVLSNNDVLKRAIRDEDREISHYAASFVTTAIEEVEAKLFQLENALQEMPEQLDVLQEYVGMMQKYLGIGFLDGMSRSKTETAYVNALDKLLALLPSDPQLFISKITHDINSQDYAAAELNCQKFLQQFPNSEQPYLMYLKLYQKMRDYDKLQEKLRELKKCPIQLTTTALNAVRFWDQEGSYV